jgi:hypothetical protein
MDIFNQIAERKIAEAIKRGEFDDLQLKGTRLNLTADAHVPAELQMGYKILKNAGVVPEELALGKEIRSLQDLIDTCTDPGQNPELNKKLRDRLLQLNILMERRGRSVALQNYISSLECIDAGKGLAD